MTEGKVVVVRSRVSGRDFPISFSAATPDAVVDALVRAYKSGTRIRVWYGDAETGRAETDTFEVVGRLGISTGWKPIFILVHNARSLGGGSMPTHRILRIAETKSHRVLYEHPYFHLPTLLLVPGLDGKGACVMVHYASAPDYTLARFDGPRAWQQATNYKRFITGDRMAP